MSMEEVILPDLNHVVITGVLTTTPQATAEGEGRSICHFQVLSTRKYLDNAGRWRESVCSVGVRIHDNADEPAAAALAKGDFIIIEGELQNYSYQRPDGSKSYVVEILAHRIQPLNVTHPSHKVERAPTPEIKAPPEAAPFEKQPEPIIKPKIEYQVVEPTDFDFGFQTLRL
jgi:single stranded DNA-binding protein